MDQIETLISEQPQFHARHDGREANRGGIWDVPSSDHSGAVFDYTVSTSSSIVRSQLG
jgi:hypothetical protein